MNEGSASRGVCWSRKSWTRFPEGESEIPEEKDIEVTEQ